MSSELKKYLEDDSKLKWSFEQRWKRLVERSREKGLELPPKDELFQIVWRSWISGFKCEYCGMQMETKSKMKPPVNSYSLEHKLSLDLGGDNFIGNFAVVCTRCNIVKGTLRASTYMQLLDKLKDQPSLLDRIYMEIWSGRLAEKMERSSSG